jgi:hypothetical protein
LSVRNRGTTGGASPLLLVLTEVASYGFYRLD